MSGVQGTITVAALFGSNGKVLNVLLIKRLGYGLDEQAISAARAIRFEPQQKDGKAVSVVRLVSYTFNIY
jgi:TonB family protein